MEEVFGDEYDTVEAGVRRWQVGHEWSYFVNAKKIRLDEDTILLCKLE